MNRIRLGVMVPAMLLATVPLVSIGAELLRSANYSHLQLSIKRTRHPGPF
jgi:hypothetical protein